MNKKVVGDEERCRGDGIAPTAKAALWRRNRFTKLCGTLVGATVNKPICVMQAHLVQLYSIQIAPWRAWQPCWAMLSGIPSSSARYLVEFSRRHGVDIELKRPPTTFANAAYTASPLTYPAVVRLDVHLQPVSPTISSGFLRS